MKGGNISGNTTTGWGGGIYLNYGTLKITGGIADSQSGDGWAWDKDTRTLTISKNVSFATSDAYNINAALTLPEGASLVVEEGVTADFNGAKSSTYGISAGKGLTFTGGGTVRAGCSGDYTSAIFVSGLKAENVTLDLYQADPNEAGYGIYSYSDGFTLENCDVTGNDMWLTLYSGGGDVKITGGEIEISNATAAFYFRNGATELTGSTVTISNAQYGIYTDTDSNTISDCNIKATDTDYAFFCNARTPGD